jgi:hypothetical protein
MTARSFRSLICAAALAALGGTSVACMPEPPPTPGLPPIAVACHDGLGSDFRFNGPINTIDNADIHGTSDGSCGRFVDKRTLVQASSKAQADALCSSIGKSMAIDKPLDDPSFGYSTLVAAWECF